MGRYNDLWGTMVAARHCGRLRCVQLAGGLEEGEATTRQWVTMEAEGSQGALGTVGHCTSVAGNSGSWEALWKVN